MVGNTENDGCTWQMSTRQWVLNITITLCSLFLVLAYEASMTAGLVQETMQSDFHSVQDFKSCKIANDDVCLPRGDAVQSYWENSILSMWVESTRTNLGRKALSSGQRQNLYRILTPGFHQILLVIVWNRPCNKGQMPHLVNSYDEIVQKTVSKECKFSVVDGSTARFATTGKDCRNLVMTGEPANWGGVAFILPRGSEYVEYLTNITIQLRENGGLRTLDEFFSLWGSCPSRTSTTLAMSKLRFFFVIAYGCATVIFFVMILDPQRPPSQEDSVHSTIPETENESVVWSDWVPKLAERSNLIAI